MNRSVRVARWRPKDERSSGGAVMSGRTGDDAPSRITVRRGENGDPNRFPPPPHRRHVADTPPPALMRVGGHWRKGCREESGSRR
jgi:hypothetical protein